MIGAGLIKLRGDSCWRDLTCLYYHYETQPIPNPISRYLHFRAPLVISRFGTAWNHFSKLVVALALIRSAHGTAHCGRPARQFQIFLIISGNLSFLNYLTIIPFLALRRRHVSSPRFAEGVVRRAERAAQESEPSRIGAAITVALSILVAYLSIAPVLNLVSGRQLMNYSYDPARPRKHLRRIWQRRTRTSRNCF
jgi:hypothetical protein